MSSEEHEVVSIYPFSDEEKEALLSSARECTFNWSTKDGWPVGVIHAFVWRDGRGWITCGAHRHRVAAIRRDPRCSVVVSGVAASEWSERRHYVQRPRHYSRRRRNQKAWFYPALARGPVHGYGR